MTETQTVAEVYQFLARYGELLDTPMDQQVQVRVQSDDGLRALAEQLAVRAYYLVTVVANDERELEGRRYKIYYAFSHPVDDLFVVIEYLLDHGSEEYSSIWNSYQAVEPFEREMCDMVGLRPIVYQDPDVAQRVVPPGSWLHDAYPPGLFPLRRTRTAVELLEAVRANADYAPGGTAASAPTGRAGGMTFPVGPIHAGVIEPGQFLFATAGEVIEDLQMRLGYMHRGIERMFQSHMSLIDGWCLAEQVSGDTSFAHSLAYCRAAEVLTDTQVPEAAEILRALFLELERIHNHVADVGGLAEDVGMEQFAAEFSVIREEMLRLNKRLTGHRYLRGVNRVGGVRIVGSLDLADIRAVLKGQIDSFKKLARLLTARSGFRERAIRVGHLTHDKALSLGVTGLVARASGVPRDSRLGHPIGAYRDVALKHILGTKQFLGDDGEATAGDVFARALTRAREVLASRELIEQLVENVDNAERSVLAAEPRVRPENNYVSALGYAEGCRGEVVYWLMQDKMNGIYRCKVRDPSMLNWPALRDCAIPRLGDDDEWIETLVADFPLLNKSFSLSYAGNDL